MDGHQVPAKKQAETLNISEISKWVSIFIMRRCDFLIQWSSWNPNTNQIQMNGHRDFHPLFPWYHGKDLEQIIQLKNRQPFSVVYISGPKISGFQESTMQLLDFCPRDAPLKRPSAVFSTSASSRTILGRVTSGRTAGLLAGGVLAKELPGHWNSIWKS